MKPALLLASLLSLLLAVPLSAATELEPRVLGPTAGNANYTAVAFGGGKFLTVWLQMFAPTTSIWGAFSNAEGDPLTPAFPLITPSNPQSIRLFADADAFLMVWTEANRNTQMCRIDAEGRVVWQTTISARTDVIAQAFIDGRMILTAGGRTGEVFDREGRFIDIFPPTQRVSANSRSIISFGGHPQVTVARLSARGETLAAYVLATNTDQCVGDGASCWQILSVQELADGTLTVLMHFAGAFAFVSISPEGVVSPRRSLNLTLSPVHDSAGLLAWGSRIFLRISRYVGNDSYETEARELSKTGVEIGPPVLLAKGLRYGESLVFTEGGAGVLFAATAPSTADRQIQTFAFREMAPVPAHVVSIMESRQQELQIASNGTNFLSAWKDTDGVRGSRDHWAILDARGARVSAIFEGSGSLLQRSMASNGFDYLLLFIEGSDFIARRIAADGTRLGDTVIATSARAGSPPYVRDASVASTWAGYVIVWATEDAIYSSVVTPSGSASAPQEVARVEDLPLGWGGTFERTALAFDGSNLLLVMWQRDYKQMLFPSVTPPVDRLFAILLGADGSSIGTSRMLLDASSGFALRAASSGREFLVTGDGTNYVVTRTGMSLACRALKSGSAGGLIWDGSSYVLTRGDQWSMQMERVGRDGSSLGKWYRGGFFASADVAVDGRGNLVIASAASDRARPTRATSFVPGDLAPLVTQKRQAIRK